MKRDKTIEDIYNQNEKLMREIILYVIRTYNISKNILVSDTRYYTKQILKDIRGNNAKILSLRIKKDKVSKDIDDFNKAFVKGDSFDSIGAGHQKGGLIENTVEKRQIKKRELDKHIALAGLPHLVLYGFRHSHATNLIRAGVPVKVVSKRLGHKNASTTINVYWHLFNEDEEQVLQVLK